MDEGLIHSYRGQIGIAVFFLILGAVACLVLTLAVLVRKGPPLTTQTNRETGVKDHGIGWWLLVIGALTMGLPAAFIALRTLVEVGEMLWQWLGTYWPLALIVVGAAAVGVGAWRVLRAPAETFDEPPLIEPATVDRTSVVGWSLPADAPHWADPQP